MSLRRTLLLALALSAHARQIPLKACAALQGFGGASDLHDDTARIQSALDLCSPGEAVVLERGSFLSRALILPRGVTLFLGRDAKLAATGSWDISPGSCGAAPKNAKAACKPFIFAYQAAFSGVAGEGVIQGDVPELISSYESQGFTLSGVRLRDPHGAAAAIYKTTGFRSEGLKIDAGQTGVLLSNAVDAKVESAWVRASGDSIALQSSILGPTSNVELRDIHLFGGNGVVKGTGDAGDVRNISVERASNEEGANLAQAPNLRYALDLAAIERPGMRRSLVVAPGETIQSAVDRLPVTGGEITIKPGTYREAVTIRKPNVRLHGEDSDPSKTMIVFHNGPANGGTFASATLYVEAPDVTLDHLTIANDLGNGKGQAVALAVTADRAVFRNLRILGAQDTLFAASRFCCGDYGSCAPARQYFADSYIEGNTDFIFGDALAVFERCELHGIAPATVMYRRRAGAPRSKRRAHTRSTIAALRPRPASKDRFRWEGRGDRTRRLSFCTRRSRRP